MKHLLSVLLLALSVSASAQMWEALATSPTRIDTATVKTLQLEIDNITFFRDNEFNSRLTTGYTLPGLWLQPKVVYTPLRNIRLEAGLHALIFNGANKYPCYAYHDIATWKGDQYQSGVHVLPWFRAQVELGCVDIILGSLYGGENHRLIEPLWNNETNLSQDPEMGLQVRWENSILTSDTWINWQSYIFRESTHQEAFTIGTSWHFNLTNASSQSHWYIPAQIVAQHRGGEIDNSTLGAQTLSNFSVGIGLRQRVPSKVLTHLKGELNAVGSYQLKGHLWPYTTRFAAHASAEALLWNALTCRIGHFSAPREFATLYGSPFFTSLSRLSDGHPHRGINTTYAHFDYHHTFARHYVIGADAELYQSWLGKSPEGKSNEFNVSFGVYFRANPSFLLKRFRQ